MADPSVVTSWSESTYRTSFSISLQVPLYFRPPSISVFISGSFPLILYNSFLSNIFCFFSFLLIALFLSLFPHFHSPVFFHNFLFSSIPTSFCSVTVSLFLIFLFPPAFLLHSHFLCSSPCLFPRLLFSFLSLFFSIFWHDISRFLKLLHSFTLGVECGRPPCVLQPQWVLETGLWWLMNMEHFWNDNS